MTVHLVGAGPGDPELLTVRAVRLLGEADVVVHDRLVSDAVLALARPDARRVAMGKHPGGGQEQSAINQLLVELGSAGLEVVRLKGGDPFVFGRGGEEAQALEAAAVPYTVVPGITSVVAAPSAAGIPLTHRGVAGSFTVVTGHEADLDPSPVDWDALARVGGTIVVLMGVARRRAIAERLLAAGRPADTPVAVVRSATTPHQEVLRTTLAELPDVPDDLVRAPATVVIGAVAALELGGVPWPGG